ncbi:cation-translocating P-type ATPase [Chondromyces crocatus]|uniref:ATPase n=1 Tax=Chondromyces crocatus TaxID=52 RepID=A0A0K1EN49_CHOCO|nr:HAD-IC family P-type ATPase [Chondromyces crocatus]AKT42261.1 ATPase [Chondromyces crocatus]
MSAPQSANDAPDRPDATAWHALGPDDTLARLKSSEDGLTPEDAAQRLVDSGPNVIPRKRREGVLALLVHQIHNPLIYVLLGSAVLAMVLGKAVDGAVVLAVVVLNTVVGFVQELRASQAIEALSGMVPQNAVALRAGKKVSIAAAELVPGDVVLLEAGDRVPADVRLLSARNLRIEEAALTGESVPADKSLPALPEDTELGDRCDLAFGGTMVVSGAASAVVVETGSSTELGRISALLDETTELETPLTRAMSRVARTLTLAILGVSALIVGVALFRGYPLVDAVLSGISLAVAAIPEGLPAIITIALAIGVQRMARRRAIIRKLPAVETLGSTAVICSDKTGTLTRNEMTVRALWTPALDDEPLELTGVGYTPDGELQRAGASIDPSDDVTALLFAAALCNDARLERRDGEEPTLTGDPTEGALLVAAEKVGISVDALRDERGRIDAIPFASERQFMATLHGGAEGARILYLKGAPEIILARCSLDEPETSDVLSRVERMAEQGMRVLAFAEREVDGGRDTVDEADAEGGFTLLGLMGMIDPPRPEAVEAIAACRQAGITVKMITGDHISTARAIGEQLGLLATGEKALSGAELSRMADGALRQAALDTHVFARVAPEHKLRLVRALQASGRVVAMTGDGVNDAPALRQADIGVAMGITGTSVSKEAADVVLTDDNFASIRAAVEEGRRVYDNLVKSLAFVLPTNLGEALILLIAVLFFPVVGGSPLMPITAVQILWINLVATVALALPLAFEAMEKDVMTRPPRDADAPILSPFVLFRTALVAVLMAAGAIGLFLVDYHLALQAGEPAARAAREAQTLAVTTVVLFQIFYVFNCRSLHRSLRSVGLFSNPWVYAGALLLLLLQVGFVYLPFMHTLFGSAPLSFTAWLKSAAVAALILPIISAEKWWRSRRARPSGGETASPSERAPREPRHRMDRPVRV